MKINYLIIVGIFLSFSTTLNAQFSEGGFDFFNEPLFEGTCISDYLTPESSRDLSRLYSQQQNSRSPKNYCLEEGEVVNEYSLNTGAQEFIIFTLSDAKKSLPRINSHPDSIELIIEPLGEILGDFRACLVTLFLATDFRSEFVDSPPCDCYYPIDGQIKIRIARKDLENSGIAFSEGDIGLIEGSGVVGIDVIGIQGQAFKITFGEQSICEREAELITIGEELQLQNNTFVSFFDSLNYSSCYTGSSRFDGVEYIYKFEIDKTQLVSFSLNSDIPAGLFLFDKLCSIDCIAGTETIDGVAEITNIELAPGTFFLVIDEIINNPSNGRNRNSTLNTKAEICGNPQKFQIEEKGCTVLDKAHQIIISDLTALDSFTNFAPGDLIEFYNTNNELEPLLYAKGCWDGSQLIATLYEDEEEIEDLPCGFRQNEPIIIELNKKQKRIPLVVSNSEEERISFNAGGNTKINQFKIDTENEDIFLRVSSSYNERVPEAGVYYILVESNTTWEIDEDVDWLELDTIAGIGTQFVKVFIDENTDLRERINEIKINGWRDNVGAAASVKIKQFGEQEVENIDCARFQFTSIDTKAPCNDLTNGAITINTNSNEDLLYLWSNTTESTNSLINLSAGNYEVTVTDGFCEITESIQIEQQNVSVKLNSLTNASCNNTADGKVIIQTVGENLNILWSNGQENILENNFLSGNHWVTVSNENGCQDSLSFFIAEEDNIPPTIQTKNTTIYLQADGTAQLTALAIDNNSFDNCTGTLNLSISKSNFTCSDLGMNPITLRGVDNNGNMQEVVTTVQVKDTIRPIFNCLNNYVRTNNCLVNFEIPLASDNCQLVSSELIAGLPPMSSFPEGITEVIYQASDIAGNTNTCSIMIEVMNDLEINLKSISPTLENDSTGQIEVGISGGSGVYNLNWYRNNAFYKTAESTLINLPDGDYFLLVDDANGCRIQSEVFTVLAEVAEIDCSPLAVRLDSIINSDEEMANGKIYVNIVGGTGDYTLNWYRNNAFFATEKLNLENLSEGDYYLLVDDANGCRVQSEVFIVNEIISTSINNFVNENLIHLYPNPTSEYLIIDNKSTFNLDNNPIIIYDILGRSRSITVENKGHLNKIDVSHLSKGLHVLTMQIGNQIISKKFTVL